VAVQTTVPDNEPPSAASTTAWQLVDWPGVRYVWSQVREVEVTFVDPTEPTKSNAVPLLEEWYGSPA
jgi:hypothetical protein